MNVFITLPCGHIFPVTCAQSRCPEANTIRTNYMTNNSLQMSDHQRLHGGRDWPYVCDLVPDPALLGEWWHEGIRVVVPPALIKANTHSNCSGFCSFLCLKGPLLLRQLLRLKETSVIGKRVGL